MYLLYPISDDARIVSLGRYSTDEQRRQSIVAQHEYCLEFLSESGVHKPNVDHIYDEGISGEIRDRPGIRELREGIAERRWTLIICEDSSRIYRGIAPCVELVGFAVDHGVRVICINDRVDTSCEDWQQRLEEAQRHHGQDNFFTRFRIKRAHDTLFRMGAAIGLKRPGYIRHLENPQDPNSPKFDEVDQNWVTTIQHAFQMVADDVPLDVVANYLSSEELPKSSNAKDEHWNERNVISMVQCSKYRGEESFRRQVSKKIHSTGRSVAVNNPNPDKILTRDAPHLRIVDDDVWFAANEAIAKRERGGRSETGHEHPLFGIPRDSRGPLSNLFVCGICGHKMIMEGRNEGGYRCGGARKKSCWNKATALRDFTHTQIGTAVSELLIRHSDNLIPTLTEFMEQSIRQGADFDKQAVDLKKAMADIKRQEERLLRVILQQDDPPAFLSDKLAQLKAEIAECEIQSRKLAAQRNRETALPTRSELQTFLEQATRDLATVTRETHPLMAALLDGPIRAIPCQQFASNKIVLRAELTIQASGLLPADLRRFLQTDSTPPAASEIVRHSLSVDLFQPALAPKHARAALQFYNSSVGKRPTLQEIATHLRISKRSAHLALQLGKQMQQAGVSDPFIPLRERPENASRWRFNSPNLKYESTSQQVGLSAC